MILNEKGLLTLDDYQDGMKTGFNPKVFLEGLIYNPQGKNLGTGAL